MKIEKHEELMTSHVIVVHEGNQYHRREKSVYDQKTKKWVRQSLVWEKNHYTLRQDEATGLSAKQLEREYQLSKLVD